MKYDKMSTKDIVQWFAMYTGKRMQLPLDSFIAFAKQHVWRDIFRPTQIQQLLPGDIRNFISIVN
jgi:hypothetical protein